MNDPSPNAKLDLVTTVRCRGLRKAYGRDGARTVALDGVDIDIARDEIVMIMGPSGCGKTTLLSIIATLLDADDGTCALDGLPTSDLSKAARAELRARMVGFVFQSFNLLPSLTARQNVSVPLVLAGISRSEAEGAADAALASVGLADRTHHLPAGLSGGQQQRVAIARAIVHRPSLILCDEPTSALDHAAGQQIMQVLQERVRSLGASLLVVTHDSRITGFADRIISMEDGRITGIETRAAAA